MPRLATHRLRACNARVPTPRTILIVEDNEMFRGMLSSMLSLRGYRVLIARRGSEALAIAAAEPVDAVLTDVDMPEMDGFAFCAEVRAQQLAAGRDIPVWIMTGVFRPALERKAASAGAVLVLRKPFPVEDVCAQVEQELERRAQEPAGSAPPVPVTAVPVMGTRPPMGTPTPFRPAVPAAPEPAPLDPAHVEVVQALARLGGFLTQKDPAFADEFASDAEVLLVGSEVGEVADTRAGLAAFLEKIYAQPMRVRWEWKTQRVASAGDVAWIFAEGELLAQASKDTIRRPYRMSGVLERHDGRWRWRLFHGSEPVV